jgi:hypothetical protein
MFQRAVRNASPLISLAALLCGCNGDDAQSGPGPQGDAGAVDTSIDVSTPDSPLPKPDATEDATMSMDAAVDTGIDTGSDVVTSDGGGCNNLQNTALLVGYTGVAGPEPTPQGGAIMAGTYYLTAINLYDVDAGGFGAAKNRETMVYVENGTGGFDRQDVSDQGFGEQRVNYAVTISGTVQTVTVTCPPLNTYSVPYTWDAATGTLHEFSSATMEYVFTKQ